MQDERFICEPVAKAGTDRRTDIERLADGLSPSLGRAVRDALETQLANVDLDAIEAALRRGDSDAVFRLVGEVPPTKTGAIRDALQDAVWAGGAAAGKAPELVRAEFVFDRLNPALIRWLESYDLNLIREINAGTKEAIRGALTRGMTAGENPIQTARAVRESVGLTAKQAQAVANYRKFLETVHTRRSVAGMGLGKEIDRRNGRQVFRPDADGTPKDGIDQRRLRDFRYDGQLQRAIETRKPLSPEQINKQVAAYQRKYLKHRSEMIARTEALRTTNVGVLEAWRQAVADGKVDAALLRKRWIISADERTCSICKPVPELNPKRGVPLEAPFQTPRGPMTAPPAHPACRCTVFVRLFEPEQLRQETTP